MFDNVKVDYTLHAFKRCFFNMSVLLNVNLTVVLFSLLSFLLTLFLLCCPNPIIICICLLVITFLWQFIELQKGQKAEIIFLGRYSYFNCMCLCGLTHRSGHIDVQDEGFCGKDHIVIGE